MHRRSAKHGVMSGVVLPQEVDGIEAAMAGPAYVPNSAQRRLAEEVTRFVHGEEGLRQALAATQVSIHNSLAGSLRTGAAPAPRGVRCCDCLGASCMGPARPANKRPQLSLHILMLCKTSFSTPLTLALTRVSKHSNTLLVCTLP